jgi:hypothetical protein
MLDPETYSKIKLFVEFEQNGDLDKMAQEIQDRLRRLHLVKDVEAMPQHTLRFTGPEIAAAIAVTALIARGGRDAVAEVRKLVAEIKGLLTDLRDLKNVYVNVRNSRIPIEQLDTEALRQLAKGA